MHPLSLTVKSEIELAERIAFVEQNPFAVDDAGDVVALRLNDDLLG